MTTTATSTKRIVIVGAGPAGLLLAHHLVRSSASYDIHVYEKLSKFDSSIVTSKRARTFPVALQLRGSSALQEIPGLWNAVETQGGCYMQGVAIHSSVRTSWFFGSTEGKDKVRRMKNDTPRVSVDRNQLQRILYTQLLEYSCMTFHFDHACQGVNVEEKQVTMKNDDKEVIVDFDVLVACDGAYSAVRGSLVQQGHLKTTEWPTDMDYRSIYLDRRNNGAIDGEHTHCWMMAQGEQVISVPLHNDYCSGVYIFPHDKDPFLRCKTGHDVLDYLASVSPHSLRPLVSLEEAQAILKRPTAANYQVKCHDKLAIGDSVVLLGDAAHAVSASLGQGCNAALQDVSILSRLLRERHQDWSRVLPLYSQNRLQDAHAVYELSAYATPRTPWQRREWLLRVILKKLLPSWLTTWLLRPLPFDLLRAPTIVPYSEILRQCKWWTDRIKQSMETTTRRKET